MKIVAAKTVASQSLPAAWIAGTAWSDELMKLAGEGAIRFVRVTFEPGSRTAWHTHPRGQILHVVSGICRVQEWGGEVAELGAGDTIHTAPGVKHWHGASPAVAMTHLAVTGMLDGKNVEWMEKVSDEQYTTR